MTQQDTYHAKYGGNGWTRLSWSSFLTLMIL